MTPGKFMTSPRATRSNRLNKSSMSPASMWAPAVSNAVAGTHEGAV